MPANKDPMLYASLYTAAVDLTALSACTTRAPTATAGLAAANIVLAVPTTGNTVGRRIETLKIKGSSTSFTAASPTSILMIWRHDGTKAYLLLEIELTAKTPSTTSKSFEKEVPCDIRLMPTDSLYTSISIATTASTTALVLHPEGGTY
ncbi:MAG: hypothetical protein NT159_01440 [Proteobacteria bacterium]|nr:hypothetical protein [Pseudomonadota bacterium]